MQLAPDRPNVELRRDAAGDDIVVLAFPYDPHIVAVVRGIPGRRFDWDRREWWAPVDDWVAVYVAEVLERFAELTASADVHAWLAGVERRWVGRVGTRRHDGRGWWTLDTRAGSPPEELLAGSVQRDGTLLAPLTTAGAAALAEQDAVRLDAGARRCAEALLAGEDPPPPARLTAARTFDGQRLRLDVLWIRTAEQPSASCRARTRAAGRCRSTPGSSSRSTPTSPATPSPSTARARTCSARCAPSTPRRRGRSAARAPSKGSRSPRSPRCSAASSRRFSGRACATSSTHGARSSPTSRASARPSRRSRRSKPTRRSPRSSSVPRR
ncbi:MAG TPA: hypothetical protein VGC59_10010 [Solirubrobacteraceae bacterium]